MGYYTAFSLEIKNLKNKNEFYEVKTWLNDRGLIRYVFDEGFCPDDFNYAYFSTYETAKWYGYDEDMLNLSKIFPHLTFRLEGWGEDADDMWQYYYQNGNSEFCRGRVVFEEPKTIQWS